MSSLPQQSTHTNTNADFPTLLHHALQIAQKGQSLPEDLLHQLSLLAPDRKRLLQLLKNATNIAHTPPLDPFQESLPTAETSPDTQDKTPATTKAPLHVPSAEQMSFSDWIEYMNQNLQTSPPSPHPKSSTPVSETYARILIQQGHYEKAIEIYQKLMQLHPEKSNTFALQIEQLKKQR